MKRMGSVTYARVWTPFLKDFENRCLLPTLVTPASLHHHLLFQHASCYHRCWIAGKTATLMRETLSWPQSIPKLHIAFKYVNGKKSTCKSVRCHIDINKMQSECIYLPCHNDLIQLLFHSCSKQPGGHSYLIKDLPDMKLFIVEWPNHICL